MPEYARIDNDAISEIRTMEPPPPHKAYIWRPVVYEGSGPLVQQVIEADRVRVVRSELPLATVKTALRERVDTRAEEMRLRYITPGDGMQQTYREKFEQAGAVNAMGQDAANALTEVQRNASFPVLAASVGIEAATLWDCAQLVLQRFAQWAQIARLIETKRLAGKKAISEASDAAAAQAAYEAITWTDLP